MNRFSISILDELLYGIVYYLEDKVTANFGAQTVSGWYTFHLGLDILFYPGSFSIDEPNALILTADLCSVLSMILVIPSLH